MGNQSSTTSSSSSSPFDPDRYKPFSRSTGSLGLSRQELDKRCQSSGLYGSFQWEDKAIRRLIGDGKLAAMQKGLESPNKATGFTEECPICFLYYSETNKTNCCGTTMCTECYLTVRPQKEKTTCPFCNSEDFSVAVVSKKCCPDVCASETFTSVSESSRSVGSSNSGSLKKKSAASVAPHTPKPIKSGFGAELEKSDHVRRMRKRSESFASSDGTSTPKNDQDIVRSVAMTAEERQSLEEQMKAQHYHPLMLRLEAEAQERRVENDRAYQSSSSQASSRSAQIARRMRQARHRDQLSFFFDDGGDTEDMSALETAILFSRLAEERGDENEESNISSNNDNSNHNHSDHQLEGIPFLRSLLSGSLDTNHGNSSSSASSSGSRGLNFRSSRRRHQNHLLRSALGSRHQPMNDVAVETASMMMRGISEEEQIAMAIAASMQDQEQQQESSEESNEADGSEPADSSSASDGEEHAESDDDDNHESEDESQELKRQASGDSNEAATITELARVVTDGVAA